MVKKKYKSKRVTLKDKYKIQRRVVETHRKQRKQTKRDAKAGIVKHDKKKKKDPGIPNSWPFKQDLLQQISRARERDEEKKRLAKEQRKEGLQKLSEHRANGGTARTLEELMARANRSREEFDAKKEAGGAAGGGTSGEAGGRESGGTRSENKQSLGQSSRRAYMRALREVVDSSDVVLQILDARDPSGTRVGRSVEDAILSRYDKKMVLVLNKIDLVPKDAVAGWLAHLRRSHPTVAMKAGTNQSRSANVGRTKGESALQSSSGVGVEGLLSLLKNYARSSSSGGEGGGKSKSCITVGIIGYPNVGKSSILNTLKRSRAVGVSPRPGFTTSLQEVVLDKSVRLIDSPGVVFDDSADLNSGDLSGHSLLRNCVDADSVDDPIPAVQGLLDRCTPESLVMTYEIPAFPRGDVMTFLALVARRSGRKLKGGVPDKVSAARSVIRDWNAGKIMYYTSPPDASMDDGDGEDNEGSGGGEANGKDAKIVSTFGEAFDVSKMKELDRDALEGLPEDGMDFVEMAAPATNEGADDRASTEAARYLTGEATEDSDEEMDDDNEGEEGAKAAAAGAKERKSGGAKTSNDAMADAEDYDFEDL